MLLLLTMPGWIGRGVAIPVGPTVDVEVAVVEAADVVEVEDDGVVKGEGVEEDVDVDEVRPSSVAVPNTQYDLLASMPG